MNYTNRTQVASSFDEAIDVTIEALEAEGFGILSDIDMHATFEKKLGETFRRYRILGACNPGLALEGLTEEIDLGALLPCSVAVYETDEGEVVVSAVDPTSVMELTDNDALDPIAGEVGDRLERALSSIQDELGATAQN